LEANSAALAADGRPPTVEFQTVGKIGQPAGRPPTGQWPSGWPPSRPGHFQRADTLRRSM